MLVFTHLFLFISETNSINCVPLKAAKIINLGGCLVEFEALIVKNIAAVGGVGVGIGLIQVIMVSSTRASEAREWVVKINTV